MHEQIKIIPCDALPNDQIVIYNPKKPLDYVIVTFTVEPEKPAPSDFWKKYED